MKNFLASSLVLLASALLLVSCTCPLAGFTRGAARATGGDLWGRVEKRGTIIFGVKADAPPFGQRKADGSFWGFDIDIARALAHELGLKAEFVPVKSNERIPFILEGKADAVIASMTITREREKQVDFTIPYFQDGQGLLCRKDSPVQGYRDLKGRKVGAVTGSTSGVNMVKVQPECAVLDFPDYPAAVQALVAGKVDAMTSDTLILEGLVKARAEGDLAVRGLRFTAEPYGIAVPENQSRLRDQLNGALMALWEKGVWHDIFQTWFGEGSNYRSDIQFNIPLTP